MAEPRLRFVLTAESLRNLRYFYSERDGTIQVGSESVKISKELSIFFSASLYLHFKLYSTPYNVKANGIAGEKEPNITKCIQKYVMLSEGLECDEIETAEMPIMISISKEIRNRRLKKRIQTFSGDNKLCWTSDLLTGFDTLPNFDEFEFDVCGETFSCPKVLAMILSREVCKQNLADFAVSSMKLALPGGYKKNEFQDAFESVFELLYGNSLMISVKNAKIIAEIAIEIGNEELISAIGEFDFGPINTTNVYNFLGLLCIGVKSTRNTEVIEYAASNFYQLNKENLLSVPSSIIRKILDCPQLRVDNENKLFEFAKEYIGRNGTGCIGILSKVKIEYLNPKEMNEMLKLINVDFITKDLWAAFGERLICDVDRNEADIRNQRWISQEKSNIAIMKNDRQTLQQSVADLETRVQSMEKTIEDLRNENRKNDLFIQLNSGFGFGEAADTLSCPMLCCNPFFEAVLQSLVGERKQYWKYVPYFTIP